MDADETFTEKVNTESFMEKIESTVSIDVGAGQKMDSPDSSKVSVAAIGESQDVSTVSAVATEVEHLHTTGELNPQSAAPIVTTDSRTELEPFSKDDMMSIVDPEQTITTEPGAAVATHEINAHTAEVSNDERVTTLSDTSDIFRGGSAPGQSDFFSQLADRAVDVEGLSEDVARLSVNVTSETVFERPADELFQNTGESIFDNLGQLGSAVSENNAAYAEEPAISFESKQGDGLPGTSTLAAVSNQVERQESHAESTEPAANTSFDFLLDDTDFLSDDDVDNVSGDVQMAVEATTSYTPKPYAPSPYSYVPQQPPVHQSVPSKPKAFFEDLPTLSNPKIVRRIDQFAQQTVISNERPLPPPPTDLYASQSPTVPYGTSLALPAYGQPAVSNVYASMQQVNQEYAPQQAATAYPAMVPPISSSVNPPPQSSLTRSTASDAYDPPFVSAQFAAPRRGGSAYITESARQSVSPQRQFAVPHAVHSSPTYVSQPLPSQSQSKYAPATPVNHPPPTIKSPTTVFHYTDADIPLPRNTSLETSSHYTPEAPSTATSNASYAPHAVGLSQAPTASHYTPAALTTAKPNASQASNAYGTSALPKATGYGPTTKSPLPPPQTSLHAPKSPPIHPQPYSDAPRTVHPKSASVPPPPVAAGRPPIAPARTSSYAPPPRDAYSSPPPQQPPSAFTSPTHSDPYSVTAPYSLPQSWHLASSPPKFSSTPRSAAASPRPMKSLAPQPHPLLSWSCSGKLVTVFPSKNPNLGYAATNLDFVSSTIKTYHAKDVIRELSTDINMARFPGPLCAIGAKSANKSKKKEVLKWMDEKIPKLEKAIYDSIGAEAKVDAEDNLALWKCVRIVLDSDGELDTATSETRNAIRQALIPELVGSTPPDNMATFTSAGDIYQRHVRSTSNESMGGRDISSSKNVGAVSAVRELLLKGDREGAVAVALDNSLWGHALLIASTVSKEKWKDTAREFIRADVLALNTADTSSLAAVYEVFAGCGDESMNALLPPGMALSVGASNGPSQQVPTQLAKWRETLAMILLNRSDDDMEAIGSLGKLLASYGHTYAAHTCYIFARPRIVLGGREDFTLLGGDYARRPSSFSKDLDVIILSEIYELALSLGPTAGQNTILPHLQLFKYHHALMLAEAGFVSEARKYLDYIGTAIKSTPKTSFVYDIAFIQNIRELSQRLSETPTSESRWLGGMLGKPSLGNMWGNFDKKLAQFVAGDDEGPSSIVHSDNATDGRFRKLANSPGLSRQHSTSDMGGYYSSAQPLIGIGTSYTPPTSGAAALYNPRLYGSSPSSARTSLYNPQNDGYGSSMENSVPYDHPLANPYAPPPVSSNYLPELSYEPPTTSFDLVTPSSVTATDLSSYAPPSSYAYEPPSGVVSLPYESPPAIQPYDDTGGQIDGPVADHDTSSTYVHGERDGRSYDVRGGANGISGYDDDDDDDDGDDDEDLGLGNNALSKHKNQARVGQEESLENDKDVDNKGEVKKEEDNEEKPAPRGGWFSWLHRAGESQENKPKAVRAKLGEGMKFVYDKELKKWVNPNDSDARNAPSPLPPPPRSKVPTSATTGTNTTTTASAPTPTPIPTPAQPPTSAPATPMTASLPPMTAHPPSGAPPPASSAPPSRGVPLTGMPLLTDLPEQPAGTTRRAKKRPQYIPPPAP
ncbi:Sec23-binding domain of Sec16-domain-containing protein [Lipomyces kononenkoae]|uniref:Sec23-binding domain of Sec16-domain-containing protein n=1 Tax=Lipomyces kononenkoae TaxID=34357 RepID=A0ACC3STE0_LIPKO